MKEPLVSLDHAVHDGEPEPRSFLLGGEEWLEDTGQRGVVHAVSVVVDRELDVAPWPRLGEPSHVARVDVDHRRLDDDVTGSGDGVAGVDDEVRDELLELGAVSEERRARHAVVDGELHAIAEQAPQDPAEVVDHRHEVDGGAVEHQTTAEEHQLLRQVRAAHGGIEQVTEILARLGTTRYDVSHPVGAAR